MALTSRTKNAIANPSFETGTTGWGLDADYTRSNANAISGSWSIKQSSTGSFANFYSSTGITVPTNTGLTVTVMAAITVSSGLAPILSVNSGSAFGTQLAGVSLTNTSGAWTKFTLSFNPGNNTSVYIKISNNNGTVTAYYDDFHIEVPNLVTRTSTPLLRRKTETLVTVVPRGIALSGLEFSPGTIPGSLSINYFNSSQATFDYFARKGFNTVRLPFTWERIQPIPNSSLDPTYAGYIDQQIQYAVNSGLKVILDCHNYGRRFISSVGGFTSDFSSTDALWSGGTQGSGVLNVNNFQRAVAGNTSNPQSPATSYIYQTDFQIVSNGGSDTWRSLWLEAFRADDNNKYFWTANNQTSQWQLYKVVGGTQTLLDSGTATFALNTWYTVSIDIGQTTSGKIIVKLGSQGGSLSQISSQNTDAALTHGQVSVFANGVSGDIDNVTVNVNGDTTGGESNTGNYTIGTTQVPNTMFAQFWTQMSSRYKNNSGVVAYDLCNEPHDMGTGTTPSNYNTTSSWTLAAQAAINAIRANGDNKYIIAELDGWAGGQSFTTNYGSNPTPWWTDTTGRLIYSFHYYFDSDHSGSYSNGYDSLDRFSNITTDLSPLLGWAKTNNITLHCGEYGTPNTDDRWLDVLEQFLTLCDQYGVWTNHWAAGDAYSSATTLQPANNIDMNQMRVVGKHLGVNVA